jgi:hypothetical protein
MGSEPQGVHGACRMDRCHLLFLEGAGPRSQAMPCTFRLQFLHRTSHSQPQTRCHLENNGGHAVKGAISDVDEMTKELDS